MPNPYAVVPHAGTWIEMSRVMRFITRPCVVPHAGTWIEIAAIDAYYEEYGVVPHAGTWIEIMPSQTGFCRL